MDPASVVLSGAVAGLVLWLIDEVPGAIIGEYVKQWWFKGPLVTLRQERDGLAAELDDDRSRVASLEVLFLKNQALARQLIVLNTALRSDIARLDAENRELRAGKEPAEPS